MYVLRSRLWAPALGFGLDYMCLLLTLGTCFRFRFRSV